MSQDTFSKARIDAQLKRLIGKAKHVEGTLGQFQQAASMLGLDTLETKCKNLRFTMNRIMENARSIIDADIDNSKV
jgi:hypothetical protein